MAGTVPVDFCASERRKAATKQVADHRWRRGECTCGRSQSGLTTRTHVLGSRRGSGRLRGWYQILNAGIGIGIQLGRWNGLPRRGGRKIRASIWVRRRWLRCLALDLANGGLAEGIAIAINRLGWQFNDLG